MDSNIAPKLAPPGAGLPAVELFIARIRFKRRLRRGTRESFNAAFQEERARIRQIVRECSREQASRRVLIDRVRGLEDSSRFWSVWMTLEHLRIVHVGVTRTIASLSRGVKPPGKADTAAVKPNPNVTEAVIGEFEKSCDDFLDTVAHTPELKTDLRYAHPWFGPLDAFGWHALAAGHIRIHREQIERIVAQLRPEHPTSVSAPA